jgi:hypothetical protein
MLNHRLTFAAVLAAGLLSAGAASAQSRVWNLGDVTAPGSCPTGGGTYTASYGNTLACSMQPAETTTSLTVSAYSNTATGSTYATGAINYQGTGSGIGAYNQSEGLTAGSPNHAIDNWGTGQDMVLLSFTAAEVLKSVKLGWGGDISTSAYDSDFQVLRWTGSTAITSASITGKTAAQLLTAGWSLVTAVDGATYKGGTDQTFSVNASNLSSSYWLISAYNSAFGGTAYSTGADAFKLLEVAAAGKVSTPGTLALAGLALLAMTQVRRRRAV